MAEHVFEDRPLLQGVDLLREIADRGLAIPQEFARVEMLLAHENAEEGRFPRPVLAEQSDPLAPDDRRIDAIVEGLMAVALLRVDQPDHGVWHQLGMREVEVEAD